MFKPNNKKVVGMIKQNSSFLHLKRYFYHFFTKFKKKLKIKNENFRIFSIIFYYNYKLISLVNKIIY